MIAPTRVPVSHTIRALKKSRRVLFPIAARGGSNSRFETGEECRVEGKEPREQGIPERSEPCFKAVESHSLREIPFGTLVRLVPFLLLFSVSAAEEEEIRRPGPDGKSPPRWEKLDEEQKQKLRKALREVWTDPSVVGAREEVKTASEAYQKAIRNAIGKSDPDVAQMLRRLQSINEGRSRERVGGGPPGRMMGRRDGEYPMGPPGFVESLSEDERKRFREAEEKARESESVREAREALEELRERDEQLRRTRMEIHRRIRVATLNAMVEIDPSLEPIRERLLRPRIRPSGERPRGHRDANGRSSPEKFPDKDSPAPQKEDD